MTYETGVDVAATAATCTPSAAAATRCPTSDRAPDPRRRRGHAASYVGTYLAWGVNRPGWWGEGEIKFYLDGDDDFPTICGTGTEDYFGGAWNFDVPGQGYTAFTTPYLGLHQVLRPDGLYHSQQRFGMYRWHVLDPIHFASDLARRHPGARLEVGRPLPAAQRRHRLDGVVLPRPSRRRRGPRSRALDDLAVGGFPIDPLR